MCNCITQRMHAVAVIDVHEHSQIKPEKYLLNGNVWEELHSDDHTLINAMTTPLSLCRSDSRLMLQMVFCFTMDATTKNTTLSQPKSSEVK